MLKEKKCAKCKKTKPRKSFYVSKAHKGGIRSYCRSCGSKNTKNWRASLPVKERKDMERYSQLKTKYGLTKEAYSNLLEKQNYVCAICFREPEEKQKLHVDHCHKTNKIRGLLCKNCNYALGYFQDNIDSLFSAVRYLEK